MENPSGNTLFRAKICPSSYRPESTTPLKIPTTRDSRGFAEIYKFPIPMLSECIPKCSQISEIQLSAIGAPGKRARTSGWTRDRGYLSSGHPDAAGESEIRKLSFCLFYKLPFVLFSLPPCPPISFSQVPDQFLIRFRFAVAGWTDKWRSPPSARRGRKSRATPGRTSVHRSSERICLSIRILDLLLLPLLLLPRSFISAIRRD